MKKYESYYTYIIASFIGMLLVGTAVYAHKSAQYSETAGAKSESGESNTERLAPNFTLDRLGGGTIELASYRGQKPVVLDFFATWCPNCRRDMPHLNTLYEKYNDRVEIIGIDLQEQAPLVQKFATELGLTFPIALDTKGQVAQQYGVRYTNFHVLINREGNVVGSVPGDITEADIVNLIGQ